MLRGAVRPSRRPSALSLAAALVAGPCAGLAAAQPVPTNPVPIPTPLCLAQRDPLPSGVTQRPPDNFATHEFNFVHSSTNLQGAPAHEKFAAGLFYHPAVPAELTDITSAVVVTNPDPNAPPANVDIEYYSEGGVLMGVSSVTLFAEQTHREGATALMFPPANGRGSARIVSTNQVPIVGTTLHNFDRLDLTAYGAGVIQDPDPFRPGASSLQQLQMAQSSKNALYGGPFPFSNTIPIDSLNTMNWWFSVTNPSPAPVSITVFIATRNGTVLPTVSLTLPAFGTYFEFRPWSLLWPFYLSAPGPFDDDAFVLVQGTGPLVGDWVMGDFFGTADSGQPELGTRFRIGSGMLNNTAGIELVNAQLTYEPFSLGIQTMMGLFNPTNADIGPARVEYFDRNGVLLGADTFATFPPAAVQRLGPGLPSSPNYPVAPVFDGWARVRFCRPGGTGWTLRAAGDVAGATPPVFKKMWGEELTGANGAEPGPGFAVNVGGVNWRRKVAPLVRADSSFFWPGHTSIVNDAVSNLGTYGYRFFTLGGGLTGQQFFGGLIFRHTSFTYEDAIANVFAAQTLSERVDATKGPFDGVQVIGDPLVEWLIPNFP